MINKKSIVIITMQCFVLAFAGNGHSTDFSDIFGSNKDSVVTIKTDSGLGTGFYAGDNFIVTNFHVVSNSKNITFCNTYKSGFNQVDSIVAVDKQHDLIVLYTEHAGKPVKFAMSHDLTPGMELISIGSPQGFEKSFVGGNLSQIRESGLMQISIPVSPGASGSPVFNSKGDVVGVVVAQRKEAQNLNFAIPSEFVIKLLRSAEAVPRGDYYKLKDAKTTLQNNIQQVLTIEQKSTEKTAPQTSVDYDYVSINKDAPDCKGFESYFFESPKIGPIKKCICNDVTMYTNLRCQCHPCGK
jgi:S1-C subfamily serine protease